MRKNAGYKITDSITVNGNEIVLGHNEKTDMYVTWEVANGNNYFWGHYIATSNVV